ncbi:MAG: PVC-type heme-binding CxxCH protein [Rhodothermales bacterium]
MSTKRPRILTALACGLLLTLVFAAATQRVDRPVLAVEADQHLALTPVALQTSEAPADSLDEDPVDSLEVAEGLEATLFAQEPMLVNPTDMDIDARGRVWVIEGYNYRPERNPGNPVREAGDRILILEDTDGDGKADQEKVYYQGNDINAALGIAVLGNKVIVSAYQHVFVFTDTDGDDQPDQKEEMYAGIGGAQHDHSVHAFVFGPDGKLYFNFGNAGEQLRNVDSSLVVDEAGNEVIDDGTPYRQGMVFRVNPDKSEFEVLGNNFRNNYEVAVDAYGTLWQSDNDDDGNKGVRINYVMEFGNYGYTDEMTGAGWRERRTGMNEEIPLRHWHLNDPGVVPNLLQTGAGSPTGILVYEGDLLPERFRGQIIHSDAGPNVVRAYPVQEDGAGYTAEIEDIAKGTDQWFRPSDVTVAPDGSLFIADWYDPGVGGHQMGDQAKGRIFRIAPPNTPYEVPEYDLSTTEGAIQALQNPNLAVRYQAWTSLHEKGAEAEDALTELWTSGEPRYRARALWLLSKIDGVGTKYIEEALQDDDPNIRITGLRAARQLDVDIIPYVKELVDDPSPQVRREAAIALHHNESDEAAALWAELATQHDGQDRWYLEALGIGADGQWDRYFAAWKEKVGDDWNTPGGRDIVWRARTDAAIPMLGEILSSPETNPDERPRYFRAFDFQDTLSGALKDKALLALLDGEHEGQDEMTRLVLMHVENKDVESDPRLKTALDQALEASKGTLAFTDLVGRFELQDQNDALLAMALAQPEEETGITAAKLLVEFQATDLIRKAIQTGSEKDALAALMALGAVGHPDARALGTDVLMDTTQSLTVREGAVESISRGWSGENELLELVKSGRLPEDLKPVAANRLFSAYREDIKEEAAKYLDRPAPVNSTELPPIAELATRRGDPAQGEVVYGQLCSTCHVVGGEGMDFGPALSEIGDKLPKEGLYTAIIHPSEGISFGYEGVIVKMKDGAQAVGYIASETEDEIEVRMAGGMTNRYPKSEIESRTELDTSLMPEGLYQAMTEQDLVDLVQYLTTLKKDDSAGTGGGE